MLTELRGVWLTNIDSDVLLKGDCLSDAIQRLSKLQFNTIYPTVWNGGYTLYPSDVAKRVVGQALDPNAPGLKERDVLAEMVQQGHQYGLSVIPWFEFGLMTPPGSELAQRHPRWITQAKDGTQIKDGQLWLNPCHPEVQQFIVDLISEVAEKYEVDGIQLDDHFGLPVALGYDDFTKQIYRLENGGKNPPENYQDANWMRWRANKLTNLMTQIFHAVKAKRNCVISLSPNSLDFSYKYYLQDWQTWRLNGLVEELILQVYKDEVSELSDFVAQIQRPEVQKASRHIPVAVGILTGLKNQPVPMALIEAEVQAVRKEKLAGVSFFFYETLWNLGKETPDEKRIAAFENLFVVKRPNILQGWKPPS